MTGSEDVDRAGRCFVATASNRILPPIPHRNPGSSSRTACRGTSVDQQGVVRLPKVGNVGLAVAVCNHRQFGVLRPQPCETPRFLLVATVGGPKRTVQAVFLRCALAPFYLG